MSVCVGGEVMEVDDEQEMTVLARWCCLAPHIFCGSWIMCCIAWMLLHSIVPIVAAKLLCDPLRSPWVKGGIRCILSIFPPPPGTNVPVDGAERFRASAFADPHKKDDDVASKPSTWRRARAASYLLVSSVSLQRMIERRTDRTIAAEVLNWKNLVAMPTAWIRSEFILSELFISLAIPLVVARSDTNAAERGIFERFSSPEAFLLLLIAHRVVGPISIAIRAVSEEIVERMNEEMHGGGEALIGENHLLPNTLSTVLWIVWALVLANGVLGIPVGQFIQSMGVTGLVIAVGLQQYAADAVGSLTLMADRRFSTGDLVRIGSESSSLYIIDKVGILSTSVHSFMGPRAKSYFPNSLIVRAQIINESRQKQRRVNVRVHVDPMTRVEKLNLLSSAIFKAVKEATTDFECSFVGDDKGVGCELLGLDDPLGLRFEIAVLVAYDADDPLAWKRFLTVSHMAVLRVLQEKGVRVGQARVVDSTHASRGVKYS